MEAQKGRHRLKAAPVVMSLALAAVISCVDAAPGDPRGDSPIDEPDPLDQQWAEAMLRLRREYRAGRVPDSPTGIQYRVEPSPTGRILGEMLAQYPYRTDWLLQDLDGDLMPWLDQTGDALIEIGLLTRFDADSRGFGDTDDPRWLVRYAQAAARRRARRLAPLIERCPQILFTKHYPILPSFFAYTEGQSDAQAERSYRRGSALCLLTWDGIYAQVDDLLNDPYGRIRDPDVSFDGRKILFAWKKSDRLDDYHLYEMEVATRKVRQLTEGLGVADFEPCYLPDGNIAFSSSRCVQTVDCFHTEVSNLYICGPRGEHPRRLAFDQVHTVKPSLTEDGQILYTRWDYNDRGQVFPQGLFRMNADGTGQTEFYGNNSWFPTTLCHPRDIPGTPLVVAIAMGHHTWQAGKLILLDITKGRQENSGAQLVAPIRETPAERIDRWGQEGDLFQYPYPLNDREFLVAYSALGGRPGRFSIYYMDIDGNRELLASDPKISCQHPMPLAPRKRPTPRPSLVDHQRDDGAYYVQDVYYGPGLKGVERGTIKKIRVVELEFRAAWIGANHNGGPAGRALISTPVAIGNGAWDVKRIVGDAEVQPDGSAYFRAPARRPLYFQCLDEHNRTVQTMRSWSTLQGGETFSCIGCHEEKNNAPLPRRASQAFAAGIQTLKPFDGSVRGFSYPQEIQPILDAKCVDCHRREGEIDLGGAPVPDRKAKRVWSRSYVNLTGAVPAAKELGDYQGTSDSGLCVWVSSQSVPEMIPPRSVGSTVSPLIDLLLDGHGDLTPRERDKFIAWVDLGVPYCGDYREAAAWTAEEQARYASYQAKRDFLVAQDRRGIQAVLAGQPFSLPLVNRYRNIAPEATVTASSHWQNRACFAPENVIDGNRSNEGHGPRFPSWGPEKRDDLWLEFRWSEEVFVDRVDIYVRADFAGGHDSWWKSATLELSDGRHVPFTLRRTPDVQRIAIPTPQWPPTPIRWLRFTDLVPNEDKWCGLTEVEVMGRHADLRHSPARFTLGTRPTPAR